MSIERDLSHKIEIELESNLYPFLINNIKMLLNNKENIVHNFGNVTFKTGHVRLNIDDSVQEEYDTIQKEINEHTNLIVEYELEKQGKKILTQSIDRVDLEMASI